MATTPRFAWLHRLLAGQQEVLVLGRTGFRLLATIAIHQQGEIRLTEPVLSRLPDFNAALDEVLTELQRGRTSLPKRVVLTAECVLPALLDLPVDPAKPRPREQMAEMVRWELEPSLAQYNELWTIGAVLQGLGYLDATRRHAVALETEINRQPGAAAPYRFGETALNLGLINRTQLDEALSVQQRLQVLDERLECNWRGWRRPGADGASEPLWLACAASARRLEVYRQAMLQRNLQLLAVYPLLGATGQPQGQKTTLTIEVQEEVLCAIWSEGGNVCGLRLEPRMEREISGELLFDLVAEWLKQEVETIALYSVEANASEYALQLETIARREVRLLASSKRELRLAALTHIATLTLAPPTDQGWVAMPGKPAAVKPWKHPDFGRYAATGAVLLALVATEGGYRLRIAQASAQLATLKKQEASLMAGRNQASQLESEGKHNAERVVKQRAELEALLARRDLLQSLSDRLSLMPDLLRALASAIGDEVVLDAIHESDSNDPQIGIRIRAWSISDAAAQQFANRTLAAVQGLGFTVAQTDLSTRPGRSGEPGYEVSFWLIPQLAQDDLDAAARKETP